jgi:hypothetical protein
MIAIPLSFTWVLEPGANPAGYGPLVSIFEFGGLIAALAAFLLGRQARARGDRSVAAVWGPRLGAAAMLGFLLLLFGAGSPIA